MRHKVIRFVWVAVGWLSLVVGIIGAFLPVLPTVPFLLFAAYCFSKGNEKLHYWLVHHPVLGHPIRDWIERRVIRPRSKIMASLLICSGIGSVWWFVAPQLIWLKLAVTLVMIGVIVFILSQRSS